MSSSTLRERRARPYSRPAVKDLPAVADVGEVGQAAGGTAAGTAAGGTAAGTAAGATVAGTRCPRCSAAVRPGAPWCTQCYAPVGAAPPGAVPEQPAVQSPVQSPPPPPVPAAVVAAAVRTAGTWPCCTCAQANDLALAACEACGTPFLAAARGTPPSIVLPGVGDLLSLSPVRRTGLAVGVVVALVVVGALLALLLGRF